MSSFKDYNVFNSINPDALAPKPKPPLPFPLENLDTEVGLSFDKVQQIYKKLCAAESNPINNTPARKRRLKSLKYKTKTCLNLLKEISAGSSELWF